MTETAVLLQERLEAITSLGVMVSPCTHWVGEVGTPERHEEPLPGTVQCVMVPFTSEEWCSITMRDGEYYVGGCCGNMSGLQDIIDHCFRFDSGVFSNSELCSVGEIAKAHGDFDEFMPMDDAAFAGAIEAWQAGTLDPWQRLGTIYNALEPALLPDHLNVPVLNPVKERSEERAMLIQLSNTLNAITWQDLFTREDPEEIEQHNANRLVTIAKILPLARRLVEIIEAQDTRFDGVAIVKKSDKELLFTVGGPCLYSSVETAQRTIALWERSEAGMAEKVAMVQVTVTIADGLVLGEPVVLEYVEPIKTE